MLIRSPQQLREAEELVGFPAVLKPISGAASLGAPRRVEAANRGELLVKP